jgi:uncharacterized membrane protein YhhN
VESAVTVSAWPAFVAAAATLLGVGGALIAQRQGRPWAYGAAKALASTGFVAAAVAAGVPQEAWTRWALAALVLSSIGDVALAVRGRGGFLVGLLAFLVAHASYTVAFVRYGVGTEAILAAVSLAVLVLWIARRSLAGRVPSALRVWVLGYAVVLVAMVATGVGAGLQHRRGWLALGAVLVAGSDLAVARERFGARGFVNKLVGLPTYYLGQTLIAWTVAGIL